MRRFLAAIVFFFASFTTTSAQLEPPSWLEKLEPALRARAVSPSGQSTVIIRAADPSEFGSMPPLVGQAGGAVGRSLPIIGARAARVPDAALAALASNPLVGHISLDRPAVGAMERTGSTVGAVSARAEFGYDGAGVGVAVIDSGVSPWHDDLGDGGGGQRVRAFVDLIDGASQPYDDYGHGSHVAGIVAGNGYDSEGRRTGIAPAADLIVLKVLDASGQGHVSDVIAALDWVVANRDLFNIRVVNLSIAAGVYESYMLDPLTLAARAAVDAGIVVVAAAGNNGRSPDGNIQYGGITSPANAPWVLTVGASSHMGTADRADDMMAAFSSRGPSAIDFVSKPDVVAPGVGIESLTDPNSLLYVTHSAYLLNGTIPTAYLPYLSLTGTSMAAPVVTGTVALMVQANPSLTPNQVKTLLQYSADPYPDYDTLTQGAGFLNARLAVETARSYAGVPVELYPPSIGWGRAVTRWSGDLIAWRVDPTSDGDTVVWGTDDGDTVVWGTNDGDTVVWGTRCTDPSCRPVVWKP